MPSASGGPAMSSTTLRSAGVLLYRRTSGELEVLLAHPGGPFWRNKQNGAWGIPKGLVELGEDDQAAARREFHEETGKDLDGLEMSSLGEIRLKSGKIVVAWAAAGDIDTDSLSSNPVRMEWPRGSGRFIEFPEIDEIRWCSLQEAARLINPGQQIILSRLQEFLDHR